MAGSGFCCGAAPDAGSVAELVCGADAAGLGCCPSTGPEPARGTAETEGPATVAELACGIAETKLCSGAAPATTRKVTAYRNETMERSSLRIWMFDRPRPARIAATDVQVRRPVV